MIALLDLFVEGRPAAKQSFKYNRSGKHYQTEAVNSWQEIIGWNVKLAYKGEIVTGELHVTLDFFLAKDYADCDNLAKAVLDGMQGIVYKNDNQIKLLLIRKQKYKQQGVQIRIEMREP